MRRSKTNLQQGAHIHQPTAWPVPHACAQPYHPGSGSHGQQFRPYWGSSVWHSRRVNERGNPRVSKTVKGVCMPLAVMSLSYEEWLLNKKSKIPTETDHLPPNLQCPIRFAIEDATSSWPPGKLDIWVENITDFWRFCYLNIPCLRINITSIFFSSSSDKFAHF